MSVKRSKLTADKARERVSLLEESISLREQKLEHLRAKLARSAEPEEKLLRAEERLSKRLDVEREQLAKLKRLLSRQAQTSIHDSAEYYSNEELDDLHRSFEEVRQDLSQVKMRLENTELPRDLPTRISSFEERLSRREEADTGVFTQLMSLQAALDQERETIRKMSRRVREQEQSLEALREAVEDSVVATVDLAERLDEMDESLGEHPHSDEVDEMEDLSETSDPSGSVMAQLSALQARYEELAQRAPGPIHSDSQLDLVMEAIHEIDARLEELELLMESAASTVPVQAEAQPEPSPSLVPSVPVVASSRVVNESSPSEIPALTSIEIAPDKSTWQPAKFAPGGKRGLVVATFSKGLRRSLS